jgi:uncharacterized membrane protein YuzA (DUF378 family)
MKKRFVVFLALGLLILPFFFLNGVKAQDDNTNVAFGLNSEQIENTTTQLTTSWAYLAKEWKTILLKNSVVQAIDAFCTKISVVFFVLFAEQYSLSMKLLFVIIFWFFFLFVFFNILKYYSAFSKQISFVISLLIILVSAHIKLLELPANGLIWIFFGTKAWWVKLIWGVAIFAAMILIYTFIKKFGKNYKEGRAKAKEELNRLRLEGQVQAGQPMADALSKISKE